MDDPVTGWSVDEIDSHYTMGACHVMALAIAERTGLPLGVMWNGLDWHIEPDEDGMGGHREVVHVYVDCGDGNVLDVRGLRSLEAMKRDMAEYDHEACPCEPIDVNGIMTLVDDVGCLAPLDQADIDEAIEVIHIVNGLRDAVELYSTVDVAPAY